MEALIAGHLGVLSPELGLGQVGIAFGPLMAAVNIFAADILGHGGHGAEPQKTVDPVVISAEVILAWQRIISRELSPLAPAVISIGKIRGGETHNIIPSTVSLQGTLRYFDEAVGAALTARLEAVLAGVCQAWRADYSFKLGRSFPAVVNDPGFTRLFQAVASDLAGPENVKVLAAPVMVSEDASFFLQQVPGAYFLLGAGDPTTAYPHHHPRFDFDESVLWLGAALLAETAWRYCQDQTKSPPSAS